MKKLAPRFHISDVALAKACRRAMIPVPERGYWARIQAGKNVPKDPLPPRGLGMSDGVTIGEHRYETHSESEARILNEPIPPRPIFAEDIAQVAERVRKLVGKVPASRGSARLHPLTAQLLDRDDRRRQAHANSSYSLLSHAPLFDSPSERRRLRLLNVLFLALQRNGARPQVRDDAARDTAVQVGHQTVPFTLEVIPDRRSPAMSGRAIGGKATRQRFRLTISSRHSDAGTKSWEDSADTRLDEHLTEIVVELLVRGEANYRAGVLEMHEWWLTRRAEVEREVVRRKAEEERRERERLAKLEKELVEHLLAEADNWRRAADLRTFVKAVGSASQSSDARAAERLERWSASVLALADQIDPIRSGRIPNKDMEGLAVGE
jgi:hypothetical protein